MRYEEVIWSVQGRQIPIKIYYEQRNNTRAAIGKKAVLVRIPHIVNKKQRRQQIDWAHKWLDKIIKENPAAVDHIHIEELPTEYILDVWGVGHKVKISYTKENIIRARYEGNLVTINIAESLSLYRRKQELVKILSKIVANKYTTLFQEKVAQINNDTFQVKYGQVKLKYTRSRWGSCSNKGNLNFSTRLLLCPEFILEYIIIHELAHRIEMNHSRRFWNLVEHALPTYQEAERWLKQMGDKVSFVK